MPPSSRRRAADSPEAAASSSSIPAVVAAAAAAPAPAFRYEPNQAQSEKREVRKEYRRLIGNSEGQCRRETWPLLRTVTATAARES